MGCCSAEQRDVEVEVPINIALIKYWGKRDEVNFSSDVQIFVHIFPYVPNVSNFGFSLLTWWQARSMDCSLTKVPCTTEDIVLVSEVTHNSNILVSATAQIPSSSWSNSSEVIRIRRCSRTAGILSVDCSTLRRRRSFWYLSILGWASLGPQLYESVVDPGVFSYPPHFCLGHWYKSKSS